MEFTVQKIAENIWAIGQKGVRAILLVGQGNAVPAGPAPDWFPDTVKTYRHGRAQMYH